MTIVVTLLAVLLQCSPALQQQLQLQTPMRGWDLITGNLVHWSWNHLSWDLLVFLLAGLEVERRIGARRTAWFLLGSALAVSSSVLILQSELIPYRGLSGVVMGLCVLLTVQLFDRSRWAIALIAVLLGKILLECLTASTLFAAGAEYTVAPSAHLGGVLFGILWVALERKRSASSGDLGGLGWSCLGGCAPTACKPV